MQTVGNLVWFFFLKEIFGACTWGVRSKLNGHSLIKNGTEKLKKAGLIILTKPQQIS